MGYFAKLRQSKEFARQKKAEEKTQAVEPAAPTVRYKHVPQHARIDAENATALWHTEEQRQRIQMNSKRRSQMLFSSRSNSGASTPTLGRSSSYQDGFGWNDRGDAHARPAVRRGNSSAYGSAVRHSARVYVSKEPLPENHASSSNANDPSSTGSSRTSLKSDSSSQEYLEMKRPKHISGPYNDQEILEQLHRSPPSPTRNLQPSPTPQIIFNPAPAPTETAVAAPVASDTKQKKSFLPWKRSSGGIKA